jgi:MFS transporter, MHS family, citrate/tricarballylate:H+ symporter
LIWLPIGGAVSDRIGRLPVMLAAAAVMFFSAWPGLAYLANAPTLEKLILVEMIFSLGYGVYNGAMVASLTEVVPAHMRASAFALAYSLAAALFGTATPLVSKGLIGLTGNNSSPAAWLMISAAASVFAATTFYSRAARERRG